jgi:large subunit ribosomal protein L32
MGHFGAEWDIDAKPASKTPPNLDSGALAKYPSSLQRTAGMIPPWFFNGASVWLALFEEFGMQPVMKISKSRKRKRRSHHALRPIHYVRCPQCSNAKLPHAACDNCGYVNPKLALQMENEQA